LTLLLAAIFTLLYVGDGFWNSQRLSLRNSLEGEPGIEAKIALIADQIATGASERFLVKSLAFSLLSVVGSLALGIWAFESSQLRQPSFLRLTRKSEERRTLLLKKAENKFTHFLASILVSVLCGILGNFLFAYYIQGWRPN
jgi:hypothetical protein